MRRNIFIGIIVAIPILICLILSIIQASHQDDWKKRTTPLPEETRELLCSNFGIPPEDSLCSANKEIYAVDFLRIILDTFRPYEEYETDSSEAATYDDVEKMLGSFKYQCGPDVHQADGLTYFSCSYDLRGDREFVMTFLYTYPEKAVMRIMSTSLVYDY